MRTARIKAEKHQKRAYYHCVSRVVERRFALGEAEKEKFKKTMRGYEDFCGIKLLTYCLMSNHFHVLVEVPRRPPEELLPTDAELVRRLRAIGCEKVASEVADDLALFRQAGNHRAAEELRERFFRRMWDVSWFIRLLKQRFTQWLNSRDGRTGTLWEGRFRSVLVEAKGSTLATMAAYIDLNPIRAGIVSDPKDYRWSGYGEAVAGNRLAREGLAIALSFRLVNQTVTANRAIEKYRSYLYESGQPRSAGLNGEKPRRGFTPEEIDKVLANGGKLPLQQALLCRLRYFIDGAALGSRSFLEGVFKSHRNCFSPNRKAGARPLRGIRAPGLYVARALRVQPIG
jgi:REP element-mobilizing transposase RayT